MRNNNFESSADHPSRFGRGTEGNAALKAHVQLHARGYGVNPRTMLCADALNQYAQPVLLLPLLPEHPRRIAPCLAAWRPLSYLDYFASARPSCAEFMAVALRFSPKPLRETFERAMASLADATLHAITAALSFDDKADPADVRSYCGESAADLRRDVISVMNFADPELAAAGKAVSASPFFIRRQAA